MSEVAMDCVDHRMLINGQLQASEATIAVVNPATGLAFATAPDCSDEQLDEAVASAQQAFLLWRDVPLAERQAAIRAAGARILEHVDALTRLLTLELGRPLVGAAEEIKGAGLWMQAASALEPPVHVAEDIAHSLVETRYVPLGVVCALAPWNFPVQLAMMKVAPALLSGCTVVLKPSPFTPLCTLKIGELLRDIFPPGVFNVISGGDSLGPRMTRHPGFAKISFTGSTATGKRVLETASRDLKRVTLELGGNDAAIVMPDVDLDEVAVKIFFGAFFNSAQVCLATKRLYIHNDIYDALRDRLVTLARSMPVGNGMDEGIVFGPIQNAPQFERVKQLIADARAQGLTLIEGMAVPQGAGYFVPLTLVDNPPEDARVVTEEAFGPVLPLLRFSDTDDVVRRANDSDYGLAAAIWSRDIAGAMALARRIESGTVWINQNLSLRPDTPFAGHKQSGFGAENGMEGLLEFMAPQAMYVAR